MKRYVFLLLLLMPISLQAWHVDAFEGIYKEWMFKRVDCFIEFFGEDWFEGKKILEIGCGHAQCSNRLHDLGAIVTCSDGRESHGPLIKQKFPHLFFIAWDADKNNWPFEDHYDLIIHMGLLYHLKDPEKSIKQVAKHCEYLVLESDVMDNYEDKQIIFRHEEGYDQGIHNVGSLFSEYFVERCLDEAGFNFWMARGKRCNTAIWQYDVRPNGSGFFYRRLWICHKKNQV